MRAALLAAALAVAAPARGDDPLTLEEALAMAARESPDLAAARADAQGASADRMASLAAVLPRIDLSASFGHDYAGKTAEQQLVVQNGQVRAATDQEAYGLQLKLTQTLFDWTTLGDVRRSAWSRIATERQYDEASLSVSFEVTRRFYEAVRADRVLSVLEKTVARSQDLVARADALFSAGRAPKSDTLQARVNLANDQVAVEAQRIRVMQARTALAQVLGRGGAFAPVAPAALDGPVPGAAEPLAVEKLAATARERRPALAAQSALVQAADSAVSSARGGWYPSLSAQASYSRQGSALLDRTGSPDLPDVFGVYGNPSRAYTAAAQLVLSMNLFEGRLTLAGVRRAESSALRARAVQVRTEAQVAKEIADARAAVGALARQVALAAGSLSLADQGLALARQRLDAGLASQLEVRDASLKLTQAELSLVQARIDHAVAQADLARAVGGGL